jgi:hypothetical protein
MTQLAALTCLAGIPFHQKNTRFARVFQAH